jgi:very-short-patch-repair endonuclease
MNAADNSIAKLAEKQHGVVSLEQALERLSRKEVAGRLARGQFERVFPRAFRLAGAERTFEQVAMAATLSAGDGAVASHRSAGTLWGFPGLPRWAEVSVPPTRRPRVDGLIVHRARLLATDCSEVKLIPSTSAARTILDLSGEYTKARVGPMLDYGLARRLFTRAEFEERLKDRGAAGRRGAGLLRILLDERPATERPMGSEFEAGLFRALREAGLPLPVPQYRVLMADGTEVFLDFAYPEVKLAIEADSFIWHASLAAWQRDRARNGDLVGLGWSILPITYDLVMCSPAEAARRVGSSLEIRRAG